MEKVEDIEMEHHDDGGDAADNNEQSQKIELAEMPVEILEHISVHLDDKSLLRASHVCTLFASVAETAFAQKYSNQWYKVHGGKSFHKFQKVMLSKYGDKIQKLEFDENEKDEKTFDLAERVCCNLNSLYLSHSPKMIHPTGLREARLEDVKNLNRESFMKFIDKNQQLEILRLVEDEVNLLDVLDGLNKLKTLEYERYLKPVNDLPTIRLVALETLGLSLSDAQDYGRALNAITCNELKSLSIYSDGSIDLPENVSEEICSFGSLISLQLSRFRVTEEQLKELARRLPNLTEFGMGITENVDHTLQLALGILPKLTKLTIGLDDDSYNEVCEDFEESAQDFHAKLAVSNTEIELVCGKDKGECMVAINKERIYSYDSDTVSFKLACMKNLDEKNLRKVLDRAKKRFPLLRYLDIINDFADVTLDITTFMHEWFYFTDTVVIKSKGPITVNANVTCLPQFFIHLKVLEIEMENHAVVDLLEKLDKTFCMRIEELSIETKDVQNDADQDMEHGNDITQLLAKFENLESLHVVAPAINFDAKHLQSVCPNLKKVAWEADG